MAAGPAHLAARHAGDAPPLPLLSLEEEVRWDLATQGLSPRPHPMTFCRRWLDSVGMMRIAGLAEVPAGQRVVIAGKVISAQRHPTARGMGFLVLEDETGRIQVACPPRVADTLRLVLVESSAVAVSGRVERTRWHRSLLGRLVRPLPLPQAKATTLHPERPDAGSEQEAVRSIPA